MKKQTKKERPSKAKEMETRWSMSREIVTRALRWTSNILVETNANEGWLLNPKSREHIRQAIREIAAAQDALYEEPSHKEKHRKCSRTSPQKETPEKPFSIKGLFEGWQTDVISPQETFEELVSFFKSKPKELTEEEAYQIAVIVHTFSHEQILEVWSVFTSHGLDILFVLAPYLQDLVTAAYKRKDTSRMFPPSTEMVIEAKLEAEIETEKRERKNQK